MATATLNAVAAGAAARQRTRPPNHAVAGLKLQTAVIASPLNRGRDIRRRSDIGRLAAPGSSRPGARLATTATLRALIFDCDGVILESEEVHRKAYNAAFEHFDLKCNGVRVVWSEAFYNELQNTVGGGKPKMRWYFGKAGWPTSRTFPLGVANDADKAALIDEIQDWKTGAYKDLIKAGVPTRPGVLKLMDEAHRAGIKVAVCSAATKDACVFQLDALLGPARVKALDCFLAGDDVARLKPDPLIYVTAAQKLGVAPSECIVIEDSEVGLKAATAAGMRCVITYHSGTRDQAFTGAVAVVSDLGSASLANFAKGELPADDRRAAANTRGRVGLTNPA